MLVGFKSDLTEELALDCSVLCNCACRVAEGSNGRARLESVDVEDVEGDMRGATGLLLTVACGGRKIWIGRWAGGWDLREECFLRWCGGWETFGAGTSACDWRSRSSPVMS